MDPLRSASSTLRETAVSCDLTSTSCQPLNCHFFQAVKYCLKRSQKKHKSHICLFIFSQTLFFPAKYLIYCFSPVLKDGSKDNMHLNEALCCFSSWMLVQVCCLTVTPSSLTETVEQNEASFMLLISYIL